jgi:hypothetical protein
LAAVLTVLIGVLPHLAYSRVSVRPAGKGAPAASGYHADR